jgi:phospholipid N-methyltransferase
MSRGDHLVFFREFRRNYHTTGAIAPSSRWLGAALSRYVREPGSQRRVLEVGPGTGAVTRSIVTALAPDDTFDLVELNDSFVATLRDKFANVPAFRAVADRSQVLHQRVEDLPPEPRYDLVISGLPLNNFSVAAVEQILQALGKVIKPGGMLSFFEYVAIRRAKGLVCSAADRERLRGIARLLTDLCQQHEIRRDCVLKNLPPAWVHHLRFGRPE